MQKQQYHVPFLLTFSTRFAKLSLIAFYRRLTRALRSHLIVLHCLEAVLVINFFSFVMVCFFLFAIRLFDQLLTNERSISLVPSLLDAYLIIFGTRMTVSFGSAWRMFSAPVVVCRYLSTCACWSCHGSFFESCRLASATEASWALSSQQQRVSLT